jgi:hypothetical protein
VSIKKIWLLIKSWALDRGTPDLSLGPTLILSPHTIIPSLFYKKLAIINSYIKIKPLIFHTKILKDIRFTKDKKK